MRRMMKTVLISVVGGLLLTTLPITVAVYAEPSADGDAVVDEAVPLNAAMATDLPDTIQGESVESGNGLVVGRVGAVRMDSRPGVVRVAAVRIDSSLVASSEKTSSRWVPAERIRVLPSSLRLISGFSSEERDRSPDESLVAEF